jgi:hypothetical protein
MRGRARLMDMGNRSARPPVLGSENNPSVTSQRLDHGQDQYGIQENLVKRLRATAARMIVTTLAAAALTAIAAPGLVLAGTQPAAARTSGCGVKTDVNIGQAGTRFWTHWCGLGDHVLNGAGQMLTALNEVRDATLPLHRVWLHGYLDPINGQWQTWTACVYSHRDVWVPARRVLVHDVLVSANTHPC